VHDAAVFFFVCKVSINQGKTKIKRKKLACWLLAGEEEKCLLAACRRIANPPEPSLPL